MYLQWIGIIGGTGTTLSFLPQVLRVFRSTSIDGLSPSMLIIHLTGVSAWALYGFLKKDYILVTTNSIAGCLVTSILIRYGFLMRTAPAPAPDIILPV